VKRVITRLILTAAIVRAQDPAILQIRVVEGEGATYGIGSRATRGLTVQVADETGRPIDGATVSFRLPEDGPSGTFAGGGKTEIVTTKADGRASAWGMQWNRITGLVEVRITAAKGQTRAGIVCAQYLSSAPDAVSAKPQTAKSGSHRMLWILVGVAGAAGAGIAAAAVGGKSPAPSAPVPSVTIGTPTVILGKP